MLIVPSPIFVVGTKIFLRHDIVVCLKQHQKTKTQPAFYSPVPNNSHPGLLIFGFFVGPPFLIWTARLLIFQILFWRYFRDC